MRRFLAMMILGATFLGCAKVTVKPVENSYGSKGAKLDADEQGVHFYRPALYVWITRSQPSDKVNVSTVVKKQGANTTTSVVSLDTEAGYTATMTVLPDFTQEYVIQWSAGMGNVHPQFELVDGWNLKSFDALVESKTSENITAITGAVSSLGKLAAGGLLARSPNFKGAGLYRLSVAQDGTLTLGNLVVGLE